MLNLTFEQRIAMQIGELVIEIKRLETIRDQMSLHISSQDKENPLKDATPSHEDPSSTQL